MVRCRPGTLDSSFDLVTTALSRIGVRDMLSSSPHSGFDPHPSWCRRSPRCEKPELLTGAGVWPRVVGDPAPPIGRGGSPRCGALTGPSPRPLTLVTYFPSNPLPAHRGMKRDCGLVANWSCDPWAGPPRYGQFGLRPEPASTTGTGTCFRQLPDWCHLSRIGVRDMLSCQDWRRFCLPPHPSGFPLSRE